MRTLLLAGAAVLGLAAVPALAAGDLTASSQMHRMTVQLPGGGVAHISYTGNVAPKVLTGSNAMDAGWPAPAAFRSDPVFADFERMQAQMDRQMDAAFRQARLIGAMADTPGLTPAVIGNLSPGAFSWIATANGGDFCSRSVEITQVNGQKPTVVSHSSGKCGGTNTAAPNAAAASNGSATEIKYEAPATKHARTSL